MNDKELTTLIQKIYQLAQPERRPGKARQLRESCTTLQYEWKRRMERQKAKESRYV